MPVNHRDFWYATYTLYSVSETVDSEEKLNDAASGSSGGDQASGGRQLTMVSFLKPVLKQIIMAGKSMQLLRNLDCKEAEKSQRASRGQCFVLSVCFSKGRRCIDRVNTNHRWGFLCFCSPGCLQGVLSAMPLPMS